MVDRRNVDRREVGNARSPAPPNPSVQKSSTAASMIRLRVAELAGELERTAILRAGIIPGGDLCSKRTFAWARLFSLAFGHEDEGRAISERAIWNRAASSMFPEARSYCTSGTAAGRVPDPLPPRRTGVHAPRLRDAACRSRRRARGDRVRPAWLRTVEPAVRSERVEHAPRYVEELAAVEQGLGLSDYHLFGNSWAGCSRCASRSIAAAGREPLLSGTPHDMPRYIAGAVSTAPVVARSRLEVIYAATAPRLVLLSGVRGGNGAVLQAAFLPPRSVARGGGVVLRADGRRVLSGDERPERIQHHGHHQRLGCHGGTARDRRPVLAIAGRYDELSPESQEDMAVLLPNGEFTLVPEGAHMAFWDDRTASMTATRASPSRRVGLNSEFRAPARRGRARRSPVGTGAVLASTR